MLYPPARWLSLQCKNIRIWLGNRRRKALALKLLEAKTHAPLRFQIGEKKLAFDSFRDSLEQQFSR
ncbi:MAG TPA: hypothetical protein V6D17_11990 [Candidatus Obscuribacterales bacterium]